MSDQEKGLSLYEIAGSLRQLEQLIEEDGDLTEYLDSVELQLNYKVENIVKFNRGLELSAEAIDAEIQRLMLLKRAFVNKRQRLLDYVKYTMESHGVEKIDTGIARLSFRKSKAVVVDDEAKLTDEFLTKKVTITPNKIAIKEALDRGQDVPGARIEEHKNLQVK